MKKILLSLVVLIIATIGAEAHKKHMTENQKIEKLINYVANSKDIIFIRNGDEHSATDAAKHLQRKRDWFGDDITSAKQFIEKAATKSSMSGKYYTVKLKNGTVIKNSKFLLDKLKELEQ